MFSLTITLIFQESKLNNLKSRIQAASDAAAVTSGADIPVTVVVYRFIRYLFGMI